MVNRTKMDRKGCRLCLGSFPEDHPYTIEDFPLKEQLTKVLCFSIVPREGLPNGVCIKCMQIVSEYYEFSETVRRNQEQLLLQEADEKKEIFKTEPTEFVEAHYGDNEVQDLNPENELKEEDSDDDFSDGSDHSYAPSEKEKSEQSDYEPGEFVRIDEDQDFEPIVTRRSKKLTNSKTPKIQREAKSSNDSQPRTKRKSQSKQELKEQFEIIYEFYKMTCELCKVVTDDYPSLRVHYRKVHKRDPYIVCCKKKLITPGAMLEHRNLHVNPTAYKCDICNKCYSGKSNVEQHKLKAHGNSQDRPFKCYQCPKSFLTKAMLRSHSAHHQKSQCMECGKLLSGKAALRSHQINMHSDVDRRKICDTCGQGFKDKVCFERHVKEHMGIEVLKRYQCHLCQKWLRGERGLQFHLQFVHYDREKTHFCDICNKQYPTRTALWSHKRVVHVAEKYECEFCGAKFKQALNLKEHRTIHTGEILYSCEYCNKSMNSKANFYIHTKKNHPLEWAAKRQKTEEMKMAQAAT